MAVVTGSEFGASATIEQLAALALRVRRHSIQMTRSGASSHVASCLSMADLLAVLYGRVLRVDPARPDWPDRDRFVLSKGHAAAALYAVLAERGFADPEILQTFYQNGSSLLGHVTRSAMPGIEVSTGSLGHGMPIAAGMALAAKRDRRDARTFCLLSDGECDEGSTWEATLFAGHHRLDNLVAIVDYNKIQSLASVSEVMELEPFAAKWRSFGWEVAEIDGHDIGAIVETLSRLPFATGRPNVVIAHTIKGKGVSFMEGTVLWHYQSPQGTEFDQAMAELDGRSR
jgi:transketolase